MLPYTQPHPMSLARLALSVAAVCALLAAPPMVGGCRRASTPRAGSPSARMSADGRPASARADRIALTTAFQGASQVFAIDPETFAVERVAPEINTAHSPRWAPDGSGVLAFLAASPSDPREDCLYLWDGTSAMQCGDNVLTYRWCPAGGRIAFTRYRAGGLYVASTGSARVRHAAGGDAPVADFAWSGDGRALAAVVTSGPGMRAEWLHDGDRVQRDVTEVGSLACCALDATGDTVALAGANGLYLWRPAQGALRRVAPAAGSGGVAWSPAKAEYAYVEADADADVVVRSADGAARPLDVASPGRSLSPVWSPDGTRIAFLRAPADAAGNVAGPADLYVGPASGGSAQQIAPSAGHEADPVWSPDGTRIAFVSDRDGNREVYVADLATGRVLNLTNSPADDFEPDW